MFDPWRTSGGGSIPLSSSAPLGGPLSSGRCRTRMGLSSRANLRNASPRVTLQPLRFTPSAGSAFELPTSRRWALNVMQKLNSSSPLGSVSTVPQISRATTDLVVPATEPQLNRAISDLAVPSTSGISKVPSIKMAQNRQKFFSSNHYSSRQSIHERPESPKPSTSGIKRNSSVMAREIDACSSISNCQDALGSSRCGDIDQNPTRTNSKSLCSWKFKRIKKCSQKILSKIATSSSNVNISNIENSTSNSNSSSNRGNSNSPHTDAHYSVNSSHYLPNRVSNEEVANDHLVSTNSHNLDHTDNNSDSADEKT